MMTLMKVVTILFVSAFVFAHATDASAREDRAKAKIANSQRLKKPRTPAASINKVS